MSAHSIHTAQNTLVHMRVASLGERIIATLIDLAVMALYAFTVSIVYSINQANAVQFFYAPLMFYSLVFEIFWGRTLGKKLLNLDIIHESGAPVSFVQTLLRWVLRIVDLWMFFGGIAAVAVIVSKKGQRLGDLAAGTLVTKAEDVKKISGETYYTTDEEYVPVFEEVKMLSDEDLQVAKDALEFVKEKGFLPVTGEILNRSRTLLEKKMGVQSKLKNIPFLETVVKDYYTLH